MFIVWEAVMLSGGAEKAAVSKVYRPKIFASLITEVVKPGKCVGCGACVAVCPPGVVKFKEVPGKDEQPILAGKCLLCEFCYYQCPMTAPEEKELEAMIFGRNSSEMEPFGIFMKAYSVKAVKDEILKVASDGGAVTAILAYGLSEGLLQGAAVAGVRKDMPWKPEAKLALTVEDLLEAAGTKYSVAPVFLALGEAVDGYSLEKVGFVGTPCQVRAVRKMQYGAHGAIKYGNRVKLTIGLFCSENFYYDTLIKEFVASKADLSKVTKFYIRAGKFVVEAGEEKVVDVKIKEVKSYARSNCEYCTDFAANLADISAGNVDSPKGWSTVIVRTEAGMKFLEGAVEKGWIEAKPLDIKPDGILVKLASRKRGKEEAK
ncbi:MAG: Coenzyme F420 hydrogenase/dehydrogenase, beta subunit C-terminal domain [Candidatus Hecatellaceae archaeon]|nr:MAG: coenzyme F420 hydrogenase subunit beta [Candidatus Hecatellales archaeon]